MSIYKNDYYFRLSNFYLACFLFAKGIELINVEEDPINPRRSQFVFKDIPEREIYVHNFNYSPEGSPDVLVDVHKFVTAIKTLKERLYQEH